MTKRIEDIKFFNTDSLSLSDEPTTSSETIQIESSNVWDSSATRLIPPPSSRETFAKSDSVFGWGTSDSSNQVKEVTSTPFSGIEINENTKKEIEKLILEGKIKRSDIVEVVQNLTEIAQAHNIDLKKVPVEYIQKYIVLELKFRAKEISEDDYGKIKATFENETFEAEIKKLQNNSQDIISEEEVDKFLLFYSKIITMTDEAFLKSVKGKTEAEKRSRRERVIESIMASKKTSAEQKIKIIEKLLSKDMTEVEVKILMHSVGKLTEYEMERYNELLDKYDFSSEFKVKIKNKAIELLAHVQKKCKLSIEEFFKTDKGKEILRQVKTCEKSNEAAKQAGKKVTEIKEKLSKIKEKTYIAMKKAKIAMAKAVEFLKKAGLPLSNLTKNEAKSFLERYSPNIARKCREALGFEKTAKKDALIAEIEYDCAKEREIFADNIAGMNDALLNAKIAAVVQVYS